MRKSEENQKKTDGSREKQTQQLQICVHLSVELQKQQLSGWKIWHTKFKPSRIWTKRIAMEEGGREPTTQHHAIHTYMCIYVYVCMYVFEYVYVCYVYYYIVIYMYTYTIEWF
jgi:hypothetical protein